MKIKNYIVILVILALMTNLLSGCVFRGDTLNNKENEMVVQEAKLSFESLWNESQMIKGHKAYGLSYDRYPNAPFIGSIATTGFMLASIPGAIEREWITYDEGKERVLGTLETFKNIKNINGFYYHFYDMRTANRAYNSEISVIDSSLFLAGAITAGEYFGDDAKEKANFLVDRVNWNWYTFINFSQGKRMFRMGFKPDNAIKDGKYIYSFKQYDNNGNVILDINAGDNVTSNDYDGFFGEWGCYAEQLIMYILGAGAKNQEYNTGNTLYYQIEKRKKSYKDGPEFIVSPNGSIFTYQFSHAFIDFRNIVDKNGINWFDNSVKATEAAILYAKENSNLFKSYGENSWGATACDSPTGYRGDLGFKPCYGTPVLDGTIAPCGALGSIVFKPEEVIKALEHYNSIEGFKTTKYGLRDAYVIKNNDTKWFSSDIVGIDKGITAVMCLNYLNDGIVWKNFMKNDTVKNGLEALEFDEE